MADTTGEGVSIVSTKHSPAGGRVVADGEVRGLGLDVLRRAASAID